MTGILTEGNVSEFAPHSANVSAYSNLTEIAFGDPDLNHIIGNWTDIPALVVSIYSSSIGQNWFWLLAMGVPALVLFWRSRSPFLPSALLLIEAPILWSFVPASFRPVLIGVMCLAFIGVTYSFFMAQKSSKA